MQKFSRTSHATQIWKPCRCLSSRQRYAQRSTLLLRRPDPLQRLRRPSLHWTLPLHRPDPHQMLPFHRPRTLLPIEHPLPMEIVPSRQLLRQLRMA